MSADVRGQVAVVLDAVELAPTKRIGTLRRVGRRPDAPVAFAYEPLWVQDPSFFLIDPSHLPYAGDQFAADGSLAGIFTDAAPDRWGRMLLERRAAEMARAEGRRPGVLGEWEFLLGVNDRLRMGALRFADDDGAFLDASPSSVPPEADLRELQAAARELERPTDNRRRSDLRAALALLLEPGSPLGGARPKTSFRLEQGALWLAKFPSANDRRDVGAWEFVLNALARKAGIDVPETRLLRLAGPHHTFTARRFDRSGEERRLFASAMTLVGKRDRESASYVEIAEAISHHGAPGRIATDLAQLFRRVAFNILVGHRDDHLRNHGFLRDREGWRLAPAYDLNPMPELVEHELAIGIDSHAPDVALALAETAPFCRLKADRAEQIIADVRSAIVGWQDMAAKLDIPAMEIDLIASAFAT
jgi:serine/threonine-protein kinase HipA